MRGIPRAWDTALVTGAAKGMGRAAAQAFADAGAAVTISDIDEPGLAAFADALTAAGAKVRVVRCDVSDEAQVQAMVEQTVETFGRLDFACNNAGIQVPAMDLADQPSSDFDRVTGINLRGVWSCMKYELQQMRKQGSGAIVNCSSIGGLVGNPQLGAYHASKHGVLGLTKSAAIEVAAAGIRVNAVCPGTIDTPMVASMKESDPEAMAGFIAKQPIGRLGEAEEVAAAVLWLCSDGASFVIGQAIVVDGGYTIH